MFEHLSASKAGYVPVVTLPRVEFSRAADLTRTYAAVGPLLWPCSQALTSLRQ